MVSVVRCPLSVVRRRRPPGEAEPRTTDNRQRTTQSGYTLLEVVVALAVFGIFIFMLVEITAEMNANEKRNPVNFMAHPQVSAVVSRLRSDVWDTIAYPSGEGIYTQSPKVLILDVLRDEGTSEKVVWDFRTKGEVHRLSFAVGAQTSEWHARGLPDFRIGDYSIPQRGEAVRIQATDKKGNLAIDQIFQPRAH